MTSVFLEVVGTYYAKTWNVKNDKSVGDAMEEIKKLDPSLDYKLESDLSIGGDRSLAWISHKIDEPIVSRTNKVRPAGVYRIDEAVMGSAVLAWQYYIERPAGSGKDKFIELVRAGDAEGAQQLRKNISFKRVSLTFKENFKLPGESEALKDGDIVIWRCVVVLRQGINPQKQGGSGTIYAIND